MISGQALAVVWAQWRAFANSYGQSRRRFPLTSLLAMAWYSVWVFVAWAAMTVVRDPKDIELVRRSAPVTLLFIFGYWQIVPLMMVSSGLSLDLARLKVYPIPHSQLFAIEALLRVSISLEMILLVVGVMAGLWLNPLLPWWCPLALIPFMLFNLFLSSAVRDLVRRLLAKRFFRELMIFGLVLLAALPQVLLASGVPATAKAFFQPFVGIASPWGAAAHTMMGDLDVLPVLALLFWTAAAWWFGRSQFERSLRFDAAEKPIEHRVTGGKFAPVERLLSIPSAFLSDPMAALVEKEVRFMSRSARFRLLFLMGFSFGLLIWLPIAISGDKQSTLQTNYLTVVNVYALMLLGEVLFWNSFGMDRTAAQTYFVMPVPLATVIKAKNIAAMFFILLEMSLVTFFCLVLRMPISVEKIAEAFAVTSVLALFLLAIGNMLSTRYARGVDPSQSWRGGSVARVQASLLVIYPIAGLPVALAYGARFAFDSVAAFYGVLLLDVVLGMVVYFIALDSAVTTAEHRREELLASLATSQGPVGA